MQKHTYISIFLLTLLSLQLSEDAIWKLWYELGNDSFTELFCENIDAPQLECKGSCFLNEQLLDQVRETSFPLEKIVPPSQIEIFILPTAMLLNTNLPYGFHQRNGHYSFAIKEWISSYFFPPPQFSQYFNFKANLFIEIHFYQLIMDYTCLSRMWDFKRLVERTRGFL